MRVDKLTIAALTATLELYREPDRAVREIPALAMITAPVDRIRDRAASMVQSLGRHAIESKIVESTASVGAGAFPAEGLPSFAIAIEGDAATTERALRLGLIPVIGRIAGDMLLLDLRSVSERDDTALTAAIGAALS
jgi:L-seryl-tRNA(Ser) seleniumtransferase